jgi:hypothetical protein
MPLRIKKLLGALFIFLFLLFWIFAAVSISAIIPKNHVAEAIYYIVAGLGWGVPLMPLLKWMEMSRRR